FILEVDVFHVTGRIAGNPRQSKIMCAQKSDRATIQKSSDNTLRANATVVGVSPLQDFIQKKHDGEFSGGQVKNLPQPRDLRIKARTPFLQRIIDPDAC